MIDQPGHRHPQTSGEDLWHQTPKVMETTALRSMALGMGVSKKADQDKAMVREPVTGSRKLGRKGKTDTRLHTRDKVGIIATRAAARTTGQEEMVTFDIDAGNLELKPR